MTVRRGGQLARKVASDRIPPRAIPSSQHSAITALPRRGGLHHRDLRPTSTALASASHSGVRVHSMRDLAVGNYRDRAG
jgi:hypothetical protein